VEPAIDQAERDRLSSLEAREIQGLIESLAAVREAF
jgi:hypothetical protein